MTAELGLLGYVPTPADPFVFNHRAFPSSTMMADSDLVLGCLVPGPGTRAVACLGAAQIDAAGNINSTEIPGSAFLVGSGGGNDVASTSRRHRGGDHPHFTAHRQRAPYVTSPGERVSAIATDMGVFERRDGSFVLVGVPAGVDAERTWQ